MIKIVTWNVNSVRSRLNRLLALLARHKPDIICLQELKTTEDNFPREPIEITGYEAAVFGQKTYNGVAILSKSKPEDVTRGFDDDDDDPQARLISAVIDGVTVINGYFPNGSTVGSDKYDYKLQWMKRLLNLLNRRHEPTTPIILCGDTNIALSDADVADPDKWAESVLCAPPGRDALQAILDWGFTDVFADQHPDGGVYSWWDYRQLGFPRNDGLRIDHILATRVLADRCRSVEIDRDERKGSKPSDHAPVIAVFE